MQYYHTYYNKKDELLQISPIKIELEHMHYFMSSTDLQQAKMFCIGFIFGARNTDIVIKNKIEEFCDNTIRI